MTIVVCTIKPKKNDDEILDPDEITGTIEIILLHFVLLNVNLRMFCPLLS